MTPAPTANATAARIVSLAPSCTSILHALGATRNLVAVTPWCAAVAPVKRLPAIGDCWRLENIDRISSLKPTMIVGSVPFHPEAVARILALPAPFLALNPRSLRNIEVDIEMLARLTDRKAAGRRVIQRMRKQFDQVRRSAPKFRRAPRVYAEAWPNPRISSPPWVAELIELCGGNSVVPSGAKITDQQVVAARPDVILLAWTATGNRANTRATLANPLWQSVPAIHRKRVFVISDELLNTPAPPLTDGARAILRILSNLSGVS